MFVLGVVEERNDDRIRLRQINPTECIEPESKQKEPNQNRIKILEYPNGY